MVKKKTRLYIVYRAILNVIEQPCIFILRQTILDLIDQMTITEISIWIFFAFVNTLYSHNHRKLA